MKLVRHSEAVIEAVDALVANGVTAAVQGEIEAPGTVVQGGARVGVTEGNTIESQES